MEGNNNLLAKFMMLTTKAGLEYVMLSLKDVYHVTTCDSTVVFKGDILYIKPYHAFTSTLMVPLIHELAHSVHLSLYHGFRMALNLVQLCLHLQNSFIELSKLSNGSVRTTIKLHGG